MSYILDSQTIRRPISFEEGNSTQMAQNRVLSGGIARDYFGSNKRVWLLNYDNTNSTAFATIKAIYDSYLATGTLKTWEVTETNYTVSSTPVHVDLQKRSFVVRGISYLSGFTLILTEA